MRIEIKVALIGACAALLAAITPLVWSWFATGSRAQPARIIVTASPNASPYQAYRLNETPPAFAGASVRATEGYFLWPEADLSELLPVLALGSEMVPQQYPKFSDISDPSKPERDANLRKVWSVIEEVGRTAKGHAAEIPTGLKAIIHPDADDATVGLQVLRAVYLGDEGRSASAKNQIVRSAIAFTRGAFADELDTKSSTAKRRWLAAKFLAGRHVYPVLDLTISNPNEKPIIITGLVVDVIASAPAMSGLQTGRLEVLDIVEVTLDPNGGRHPVLLDAPIRIAAQDTALVRLRMSSNFLFGFLVRIDVVNGSETVGTTSALIIDIGFRPPTGSEPI